MGEVLKLKAYRYIFLMVYRSHEDFLLKHIDWQDQHFLDVGCGSGFLLQSAIDHGACKATGIEPSKRYGEQLKSKGLSFHQGGASDLPFPDHSFDVIVFLNSFHHIPINEWEKATSESQRVLKESGHLIICEPTPKGKYFSLTRIVDDEEYIRNQAHDYIQEISPPFKKKMFEEYEVKKTFQSFEDFCSRLIAADESRQESLRIHQDFLKSSFKELAQQSPHGFTFLQPMRAHFYTLTSKP